MVFGSRFPKAQRLSALLVFVFLLVPVLVVPAMAHGGLVQGVPGPGQQVGGATEKIQLLFAEPIVEATVSLERDGTPIPTGVPTMPTANLVEATVGADFTDGAHIVRYAVGFQDGESFESAYEFSYGADLPEPLPIPTEVAVASLDPEAMTESDSFPVLAVTLAGVIAAMILLALGVARKMRAIGELEQRNLSGRR